MYLEFDSGGVYRSICLEFNRSVSKVSKDLAAHSTHLHIPQNIEHVTNLRSNKTWEKSIDRKKRATEIGDKL